MSRRYVGEGALETIDVLGGKPLVVLLGVLPAACIALGAVLATRPGMTAVLAPLAVGTLVPLWLGWRSGFWRALGSVLRREPRPTFRVELDDLTVQSSGRHGAMLVFDWFEIERYSPSDLGLVLWLRTPKDGANCVLLPRRFFPAEDWDPLVALVREKLPSSAKAHDASVAARTQSTRGRTLRTVVLWCVLLVVCYAVYQVLTEPGR
ncbi:hypothetical protein [Sandaracinus amylolyticus]|uniref:hypothetical protein n=1 Tax=Sandaracinus amylolyticus TaxID=927083 RepID=UPI001F19EFB8|nr:hypothetical protein [Sandaracinus amylolyticus]UJR82761.1 Hypothetical protein I5071_48260 [Sandaracinus amylolyticus]